MYRLSMVFFGVWLWSLTRELDSCMISLLSGRWLSNVEIAVNGQGEAHRTQPNGLSDLEVKRIPYAFWTPPIWPTQQLVSRRVDQ